MCVRVRQTHRFECLFQTGTQLLQVGKERLVGLDLDGGTKVFLDSVIDLRIVHEENGRIRSYDSVGKEYCVQGELTERGDKGDSSYQG